MPSAHPLNFANRDLRNRSFKGQNLNGADFSGSDIRGCDFSRALLIGANFERVRTGLTLKRVLILVAVAVVVALPVAEAMTRTVFGALGQTVQSRAWPYVLALYISMGIAGAGSAARVATGTKSIAGVVAGTLSATASFALVGFYYGGSATGNNPQVAVAAAIGAGVLMAIASFRFRTGAMAVAVAVAGAVTGYGFAFLVGASAIAFLSVQKLVWGVFWSIVSLAYIWLTINSLTLAVKQIKIFAGTSFRDASLTNARFDNALLQDTDFSGAIGYRN